MNWYIQETNHTHVKSVESVTPDLADWRSMLELMYDKRIKNIYNRREKNLFNVLFRLAENFSLRRETLRHIWEFIRERSHLHARYPLVRKLSQRKVILLIIWEGIREIVPLNANFALKLSCVRAHLRFISVNIMMKRCPCLSNLIPKTPKF